MDAIVRGLAVYFFLMFVFRIAGQRTLAQTTNFELVLLLIISETTQQAMVDDDHSIVNGVLLIMTLVWTSVALSFVKQRFPQLDKWMDGAPLVILQEGALLRERMVRLRVDERDVLEAARLKCGIENLDEVRHAVLEVNGDISIIPYRK
jgi:uncharacterized membrane protein YcaP (DUF421 family)